jgi:hypothetical protein
MRGAIPHATIGESSAEPSNAGIAELQRTVQDYRRLVMDPPVAATAARSSADAVEVRDSVIAWGKRARSSGERLTREATALGGELEASSRVEEQLVKRDDLLLARVEHAAGELAKEDASLTVHRRNLQTARGEEQTSSLAYGAQHVRHVAIAFAAVALVGLLVYVQVGSPAGLTATVILAACTIVIIQQLKGPVSRVVARVLDFGDRLLTTLT